jgi:hypothetical protein
MTALEKIIEIVSDAGYGYRVGYGADLMEYLESEAPAIGDCLILIGFDRPDRHLSDGRVAGWIGSFSVFIRQPYARGLESEVYERYIALRTALDGAPYANGSKNLKMVSGAPQIAGGYAEPQLMIEART